MNSEIDSEFPLGKTKNNDTMNQCFPQQPEIKGDTHTHTTHIPHTSRRAHKETEGKEP